MDEDIKKIARMITELDGLAYSTHKPIVEDICTRRASESEVEQILDYMVRMCNRATEKDCSRVYIAQI